MTGSARRLVVGAAIALLAGGCAIQPDSAPRDIPEDLQELDGPAVTAAGGAAGGSDRIYLLAPDGAPQQLRTVQRDTGGEASTLLAELISGPNPDEFESGLSSAVPQALALRSVRVADGVAEVDVGEGLLELPGGDLTRAVAQIVFTASEIPGADSVLIRVDGATREWPDGSGAQHRGPLSVYDFTGWAESAQPAFPVSPSPTAASTTTTAPGPTTTGARPSNTTAAPPTTAAAPPAPTTTTPPP
jgi:sporulation and spore germination protein